MSSVFGTSSRQRLPSRIAMLLSAALIGGCLTGCSTLSEAIREQQKASAEAKTVVVAAKPEAAPLPDIPPEIVSCLSKAADTSGKTADAKVTALVLADKTKAKCVSAHFRWYRERQAAAAKAGPPPDGHPKTEKKKPAATWE